MNSRPTVLNIAMLGTGQHRDKVKSILTSLVDSIDIGSNQSAYLIDGLGAPHKNKEHLMLGTYDLETAYYPDTGEFKTRKTLKKDPLARATEIGGNLRGDGYLDAIKEICVLAEDMLRAGKSPLVLNLFGFSRGGDTILRAANTLFGLYGDAVQVNIFAVDPVPGTLENIEKHVLFRQTLKNIARCWWRMNSARLWSAKQILPGRARPKTNLHKTLLLRGYHSFATQFYEGKR